MDVLNSSAEGASSLCDDLALKFIGISLSLIKLTSAGNQVTKVTLCHTYIVTKNFFSLQTCIDCTVCCN